MKKTLFVLLLGLVLSGSEAAAAIFLKIPSIPGESADLGHKDEIEVLSFSWGVSNAGSTTTGGGGGAGKVVMQDISFKKLSDRATPLLMQHCANGSHIPEVVLMLTRDGETRAQYLKVTFTDVMVSSVKTGGSADGSRPTEEVSLNFSKVEWEYTRQKEDGSSDDPVKFGWDVAANTPI